MGGALFLRRRSFDLDLLERLLDVSTPAEIEKPQDIDRLQGWADGKIVYSRVITAVDGRYITDHYNAYGGEKPPPIDHRGIDDAFAGKASEVLYFYRGQWLRLAGAD